MGPPGVEPDSTDYESAALTDMLRALHFRYVVCGGASHRTNLYDFWLIAAVRPLAENLIRTLESLLKRLKNVFYLKHL